MPGTLVHKTNLRVFLVLNQFEHVLFHYPVEPVCWAIAIPSSYLSYIILQSSFWKISAGINFINVGDSSNKYTNVSILPIQIL